MALDLNPPHRDWIADERGRPHYLSRLVVMDGVRGAAPNTTARPMLGVLGGDDMQGCHQPYTKIEMGLDAISRRPLAHGGLRSAV